MTGEFNIAVHALVYLSHKGQLLSSDELAKNICTNPARVRKVMARLKKSNLVETKEGIEGGYFFQLDPSAVTLCQVSNALETQFVSAAWHSGSIDMDCLVASGMSGIMDDIYHQLDALCKERLKSITIQDLENKIFAGLQD